MDFFVLTWISLVVPVLVNVAFFTLLERKILGLAQSRKGPNKVSFFGVLQPFADAVKLFIKEVVVPSSGSKALFFWAPAGAMALALALWSFSAAETRDSGLFFSTIGFIVILSLGLYPLLLAGWASMSAYALVGAMRGVAQTISYEISMALFLLSVLSSGQVLSWSKMAGSAPAWAPLSALGPVMVLWLVCCVAETNRTPFDFSEGESELVSGFNVEYGGGPFALIFMAEYATILALSVFSATLALAEGLGLKTSLVGLSLAYFWVWLRATLPRYRYDKLMAMAWTALLPASLGLLIFFSAV